MLLRAMAKDVGYLRCSKLSIYTEFNKMVQAISRNSDKLSGAALHGMCPTKKGTCGEYNFYRTLIMMLNQVVMSNRPIEDQRQELQLIYQWFCLNRPLASQRVRPTAPRPKVTLVSKSMPQGRPFTAPAVLSSRTPLQSRTPLCPPSTPAIPNFSSTFITRCLNPEMIHQPRPVTHPGISGRRSPQPSQPETRSSSRASQHRVASGVSVVELPCPSSPIACDTATGATTTRSVFNLASSVAADMTLERMLSQTRTHERPATHQIKREKPKEELCRTFSAAQLHPISEVAEQVEASEGKQCKENDSPEQRADVQVAEHEKNEETQTSREQAALDHLSEHGNSLVTPAIPEVHIQPSKEQSSASIPISSAPHRIVCQPQVVTLTLTMPVEAINIPHKDGKISKGQGRNRKPKALAPVVAGFSKQRYKRRIF